MKRRMRSQQIPCPPHSLLQDLLERWRLHTIARRTWDPEETKYGYRSEDHGAAPD
jgi:hypothetical protein